MFFTTITSQLIHLKATGIDASLSIELTFWRGINQFPMAGTGAQPSAWSIFLCMENESVVSEHQWIIDECGWMNSLFSWDGIRLNHLSCGRTKPANWFNLNKICGIHVVCNGKSVSENVTTCGQNNKNKRRLMCDPLFKCVTVCFDAEIRWTLTKISSRKRTVRPIDWLEMSTFRRKSSVGIDGRDTMLKWTVKVTTFKCLNDWCASHFERIEKKSQRHVKFHGFVSISI